MMFVLKLPIVYLIGVVWWAIRATPAPPEPEERVRAWAPTGLDPDLHGPCPWRRPVGRPRQPARDRRRGASVGAR
jgi:hypothetical protein